MHQATTVTIGLLLFLVSGLPAQNGRQIRILTFNILHGATMKNDFDLDTIASIIKKTDPDLVALQEVDFKTKRAQNYDLVTELGWRTKLAPLFGRAMPYDGGEYGEGVLSKWSFISSRNVPLPHAPENEPRAALEVTTITPRGDTICFVATHLDHLRNDADRIAQVSQINDVFSSNKHPTILAGDLNDVPGSQTIHILEEFWTPAYKPNQPDPTFPSTNPVKKIDYVMFHPANRWTVISRQVICDQVASDHCALLVVLEIRD
jgi:endonuclease/exonuclease/phosphatase family metal-dependent hydrolase